jgi:hypothetical protein
MNEPSLLDYIKAKIMPWKYSISEDLLQKDDEIEFASIEYAESSSQIQTPPHSQPFEIKNFRLFFALILAIIGQSFLEPDSRRIYVAIIFYTLSVAIILWEFFSDQNSFSYNNLENQKSLNFDLSNRQINLLLASILFLILAFFAFRKNEFNEIYFNFLNLSLWAMSLLLFLAAMLDMNEIKKKLNKWKLSVNDKQVIIKLTPWLILIIISTIIVFYFRFYRLNEVLGEMFSDHAEKLLDVYEVLTGKYPVFFVRNTGREFFQFYWTALIAIIFKTGISFMSLKIGTALAGFIALPYMYFLGKELRNKWVGIIAFLFAGIAYWPNVISRVGLRFPFYPMFVAPTLFYLIRGIRQRRRNDFIYSGIALGLGLHGYSSTRFLPFVVIAAIILFLIHKHSKGIRAQTINALITLVIGSFIVFLPLFKFTIVNPEIVTYRSLTRLTNTEREFSDSPIKIFADNFWKANTMFFFSNGSTWVHSIPNRPALDIISAALYFIGTMVVIIQYLKFRNWEDIFLILAVPLLLMPSILSIAFPDENPSLNRTGGASIVVFIIVAIGFEQIFKQIWRVAKEWRLKAFVIAGGSVLFFISATINHDLVFNQFDKQFMAGAWNTSQIGKVIKGFSESTGKADDAYVIPSPHWVDTRLVGINAGYPTKDYALWPEQFEILSENPAEKLVILKPDNQEALSLLRELFPNGILYNYDSGYEGKDFYIFHIPPLISPIGN